MIYNVGGGGATSADRISYDNTESQLEATNVQGAVDEINTNLGDLSDIKTSTLNSVAELLQHWIDNGELSNPNAVPLVPIMTGYNTPSGEVIESTHDQQNYGWKAFDGNENTVWSTSNPTNDYVGYHFTSPKHITKFTFSATVASGKGSHVKGYKIQGSNDGNNWSDIYVGTCAYDGYQSILTHDTSTYSYVRLFVQDNYPQWGISVKEVQFYGY